MNKRVTLVTLFENKTLNYISTLVSQNTCKVPFGIDNNNRTIIDTLPYHFTISSWSISDKQKVINILNTLKFDKINLLVDNVEIMKGSENSYVLYLSSSNDKQLRELLKIIFNKLPTIKYNPNIFKFHITLDISKEYNQISELRKQIICKFKPFEVTINKLGLFEIYPANLIYEKEIGE